MRIDSIFEKGTGVMNEDFHCTHGNLFGVFDGATSLSPATFQDGRTGGFLAANIAGQSFSDMRKPLPDLARQANAAILDAMQDSGVDLGDKANRWCTSAAVVRVNEHDFEWAQIGDCLIMLIRADGSHQVIPPRFDHDLETLNMWKEVACGTDAPILSALHDQILHVRRQMNVTYGVLNGEEAAMSFLNHGSMPLESIDHILLFSDGLFIPKSDPTERADFTLFASLYMDGGLSHLRDHIREIEAADATCRAYPRFKAHDDIAAISIAFA